MDSNLAGLISSIAMIAAFVLGAGGMWLIVRKRQMKQGVLMLIAALVILGNVLIWTMPMPSGQ